MSLDIVGDRIKIYRGEDKAPIIDIRNAKTGRPIDLTGFTKITVSFEKSNRSKLELTTEESPATFANSIYKGARFTAVTAGAIGNSISLSFDGTKTVQEVVNEWNSAHPSNQVSYSIATPADVLSQGLAVFEGGINAFIPVTVINALLGIIKVELTDINTQSLKLGEAQEFLITVDYGQTSSGNRLKGIFRKLDVLEG